MLTLKLSTVAIALGLLCGAPYIYGVVQPVKFQKFAQRFPRNTPLGCLFMLIATAWFLYNLSQEQIADFTNFKHALYVLFAAVGIGSCIFVQDFLAVRGLSVLFLLAAKTMCDTARLFESDWRLVVIIWAYLWIIAGMWFTISPWRMRDFIEWATATAGRTRAWSAFRAAAAILLLALGFTVFRV